MTTATPDPAVPAAVDEPIVARGARYYRNTRYIFSLVLLVMGAWFAYDGFHNWPRQNELHLLHVRDPVAYPQDYPSRDSASIALQKVLGVALPLAGIGLIAWTLYSSRGAYRLSGDVLSVPGHPDVPLANITQIDKSKWDRKGIAKLDYELPDGRKGRLTLDDFVYDRPPTDRILETIEAKLGVAAAPESPAADETAGG
jgi:hypothetical protein